MNLNRIAIIVNPTAGQSTPILETFNDVFTKNKIDWDILVTKKAGDAKKFARESVNKDYDAIIAVGGDGTVREVANGLKNTNVPMGIIPGGTANILAVELEIPFDPVEACNLIVNSKHIRSIDTGIVNDKFFILRVSSGFEADMVRGASRSLKDTFGNFAYGISALKAFAKSKNAKYKMKIDGTEFKEEGISCIITNAGNIGVAGLTLSNNIHVDDGLFDVIIIQNPDFFKMLPNAIASEESWNSLVSPLLHFPGKDIQIEVEPQQKAQCDGEKFRTKFFDIKVEQKSLKVIV